MAIKFSGAIKIPNSTTLKLRTTGADPFFNDVVLLVGFDTDFNDESSSGHTATLISSPTITATNAMAGFGNVGQFDRVDGDWVLYENSADFLLPSNEDWTVEFFFKHFEPDINVYRAPLTIDENVSTSAGRSLDIIVVRNGASPANEYIIDWRSGTSLVSRITTGIVASSDWVHIAITNDATGPTSEAFFDGISVGTAVTPATTFSTNPEVSLCRDWNKTGFGNGETDGAMDELRITRNVRRYTSNFTPPTESFPRS